jgi:hypothetical protein
MGAGDRGAVVRNLLVALLAITLAACSGGNKETAAVAILFPDAKSFSTSWINDERCECIERHHCIRFDISETHPFPPELRSIQCNWIENGNVADCHYEARLVKWDPEAPENKVSEAWQVHEKIVRHVGNNKWCTVKFLK